MKVVGSSVDGSSEMKVYGTASAANAAASAQFDKFRRNELAKAKERAWKAYHSSEDYGGEYHTYNHDMFNEDEDEDEDENEDEGEDEKKDEDEDEKKEFTEFAEEKDADGVACWSWDEEWWECADEAQLLKAQTQQRQIGKDVAFTACLVAHKGFVRVGRVRVLAEASN
jgi:hypothetical protein